MELVGKILWSGELQTGKSQNGEWKRLEFVMEETDVRYPQRALFKMRGTAAEDMAKVFEQSGTAGIWKAQFDIEARSFEKDNTERWVNDINCWKLEKVERI